MITKRLVDQEAELAKDKSNNIIPGRHAFLLEGIAIEETQYASTQCVCYHIVLTTHFSDGLFPFAPTTSIQ